MFNFGIENGCFKYDIKYQGNTMNKCNIMTNTAWECQLKCEMYDACVAFTWMGFKVDQKNRKKCCLKSKSNNKEILISGAISGPRICGM